MLSSDLQWLNMDAKERALAVLKLETSTLRRFTSESNMEEKVTALRVSNERKSSVVRAGFALAWLKNIPLK